MSPYALVFGFVPGVLLIWWGVRFGLEKEEAWVPPARAAQPSPGRTMGEHEVWSSPYSVPVTEPEPRTWHDFGTGRIALGLLCLLLGVLIVAHVYPFAGSEARNTTQVALPDEVLDISAVGTLIPSEERKLEQLTAREGLDEVGFRAYGTRAAGSGASFDEFPLLVLAGRGDLPDTKIEGAPGGVLTSMLGGGLDDVTRVDHGPLASKAYCVPLAPLHQRGYGCEFFGKTFFVVVIDHDAEAMGEAATDTQEVVAQTVRVEGHPTPDSTRAPTGA